MLVLYKKTVCMEFDMANQNLIIRGLRRLSLEPSVEKSAYLSTVQNRQLVEDMRQQLRVTERHIAELERALGRGAHR